MSEITLVKGNNLGLKFLPFLLHEYRAYGLTSPAKLDEQTLEFRVDQEIRRVVTVKEIDDASILIEIESINRQASEDDKWVNLLVDDYRSTFETWYPEADDELTITLRYIYV